MATWNVGGLTIEDTGGGYFGKTDVAKAISQGATIADVKDALTAHGNPNQAVKDDHWGVLNQAISSAEQGQVANVLGGQYLGAADVNLYQQVQEGLGTSRGQISQAINQAYQQSGAYNPTQGAGTEYHNLYSHHAGQAAMQNQLDHNAAMAAQAKADSDARRAHEQKMFLQSQKAAEEARREAMKVRHGATQGVGRGTSAMNIRFARSPNLKGSKGMIGTGSLARSGRGSQVTGINI